MGKKVIAIIQTGTAIESARKKYGDFDDWFIQAMDIDEKHTKTYRVFEKVEFPNTSDLAGIIITGSSAMVTDEQLWSEATIEWLQQFVDSSIPVLGVCYGHQLLVRMLAGKVDWNPNGRELGQVTMQVTTEAYTDCLLKAVVNNHTSQIKLLASHQQSVIELPLGATLLGATKLDSNHCFKYKNNMWGLQFHPEFTPKIVKQYIQERYADIVAEGLNPDVMIKAIEDTGNGKSLLQRFKKLCYKDHA